MPKYEAPRRYFTAYDRYGQDLPSTRLFYLELLEVDIEAGVARFKIEPNVSLTKGEVWHGTVAGFESRIDPQELSDAAYVNPVPGELQVPLSDDPQLTQLEVRNFETGDVTLYWIQTQGRDPRTFRYKSFPDGAVGESAVFSFLVERNPLGYLVERDGYLEVTADPSEATHVHVVDPDSGDYLVLPIEEAEGLDQPVMILEHDTVDLYAPDDPAALERRWLEPTVNTAEATHAHAIDAGEIVVRPLAQAMLMPRPREVMAGDTLLIYGA